jgi:hypothetical protein
MKYYLNKIFWINFIKTGFITRFSNGPANCCQSSNLNIATGFGMIGYPPKVLCKGPRSIMGPHSRPHQAPQEFCCSTGKEKVQNRFMGKTKETGRAANPVPFQ